jgi:Putative beta-barrel porin-2, OmpL-like. bbp2
MKKTYGVSLGILALGLVGFTAPASRAASRLAVSAAGEDTNTAVIAVTAPDDQGTPAPATPAAAPTTTPPAPMPLPSPSTTAPLATAVPHEISAGPFGKLEVTGILSGGGMTEGDEVFSGPNTHWDVTNAQIFVQKTSGWFQFYLQGGAYNILSLGTPAAPTSFTNSVYGPLPVGYVKLVKGNFNVEVGELPTLIGAEYTFSFENMNIERGLLWNQEPAISRGIQLNETYKKLTLAFSYNDGYFSNRYTTLSGSLAYAINAANTLSFVASGNAGAYVPNFSLATPAVQNNSSIYNVIYTYTKGNLLITPYYQYSSIPANAKVNIFASSHTNAGALLANYNFKHGISLAGRVEYIKSSGGVPGAITEEPSTNVLYGPGSDAFSFTVTPTYVKDGFFIRGDFSYVHLGSSTPGFGFGVAGTKTNQPRGAIEAGIMF